jgi:hypothetical protein
MIAFFRAFASLVSLLACFGVREVALAEPSAHETLVSTITVSSSPWEKLTVGNVAASISIRATASDNFQIVTSFESNAYPVACISPYRDLRFELRGGNDLLVPINVQALHHPVLEGSGTFNHVRSANVGRTYNCANAQTRNRTVWLNFSALYPNLRSGSYTLNIVFAPQGLGQQARFAPIKITVS